ncbi:MAG: dimethylglycine dehydrogenase [Alteromonas macleodii]|jgi:dimethylglycine dehydrogenase
MDAPYMAPIWHGDKIVGEVTSCAMGYRTNKCIALGMVRTNSIVAGIELEVEVYGQHKMAVVQKDVPLWDPTNERIKV